LRCHPECAAGVRRNVAAPEIEVKVEREAGLARDTALYVPLSKATLCYRNGPFVGSGKIQVRRALREIAETTA
jgi:hypothetical protein